MTKFDRLHLILWEMWLLGLFQKSVKCTPLLRIGAKRWCCLLLYGTSGIFLVGILVIVLVTKGHVAASKHRKTPVDATLCT